MQSAHWDSGSLLITRIGRAWQAALADLTRVDALWIALPLLLLAAYASPSVGYMLPGYESFLGEDYQPLQALKFYASLGGEYHKYGPMTNFMLLPVYGASFAWWWMSGAFAGPSGDFPYGLADPLGQLSALIFLGRLFFLVVGLALYAVLMVSLRRVGFDVRFVVLAFLFCVATDQPVAYYLANNRPDGPAFEFLAASLGVYVLMLYQGITRTRGILLSLCAVCAITSKELAGPAYILPYLGLGWLLWKAARQDPTRRPALLRIAGASLATGVGSYLLLNVVYAPRTWLVRMSHWLGGPGTDPDVWFEGGGAAVTLGSRLTTLGEGMLGVLGPGGFPVVALAVVVLLIRRPKHAGMMLLPFLSITALGLWPLGFPGDRFFAFAAIALVPSVVLGFSELWRTIERATWKPVALGFVGIALVANGLYANWTWLSLEGLPERATERVLQDETPRFDGTINVLSVHPGVPGKSRLTALGFRVDPRSIAQLIAASPDQRPDRIYTNAGGLAFVEYASQSEARAGLLRAQGFEIRDWQGLAGLGYRQIAAVRTETPSWFPFAWMPAVRWRAERSPIFVYERVEGGDRVPADPTSANGT